jgi:DNA replication initiation complex subunit (GINS family)
MTKATNANNANNERQRKFQEKMYDAGFKRIYFWVKEKATKRAAKIDKKTFIEKATKLASKLRDEEQSNLFALIIKIIEGRKEVLRLREKEKKKVPGEKGGKKGRGQ